MDARDSSVLDFIGGFDKVFVIPPFQRNYEWTEKQCAALFHDIENAFEKQKPHYLGNIVYYVGKRSGAVFSEFILIDGQQRVTTILLLLCALRDCKKDLEVTDSISRRYLLNETDDEKFRIRLKQTSYDYQNFSDVVESRKIRNEENHIAKNYTFFLDMIEKTHLSVKEIYNTLVKLEVVGVNLQIDSDLEAVQTVFEKINSTGKPLSPADLIRNFLLLSPSAQEQEKLYESYWVELEKLITPDYISKFAQDYLILKICDDVETDLIYEKFKEYFSGSTISHEEILKEMLAYAKFYAWIIHQNCPDSEIAKSIEEFTVLRSDDCYCLYMYLMSELYESNITELRNIFNLLSDFLLRYRIVAPSAGGGALRTVIHQLLEKLSAKEIQASCDVIHFELSNSSLMSGRFPTDEDFKTALKLSKKANHRYGKVLFRKIEEKGRKYISIPLSEITVEHLVPQTPTKWWEDNFGGKEKAALAFDKYLNSIGNLTIMSQGGNSSNSNKPWHEKLTQIKDSQFTITSKIAEYKEWKETQLDKRNEEIAELACKVVTAPLARTRQATAVVLESGEYPISDIETNMDGADIQYLVHGGERIKITTWYLLFNTICKIAHDKNPQQFKQIVSENKIHRSNNKPFISSNAVELMLAMKIDGTDYFSDKKLSSKGARKCSKCLLDLYGLTDEYSIIVKDKGEEQ